MRHIHSFVFLSLIGLVVGTSLAYVKHGGDGGVRYVFAEVRRGNFISSITGIGQVSALQEVGLRPSVSGKVLFIGARAGEYMKQGTLIARLDSTEAEDTILEAEIELEAARIAWQELFAPPSEVCPVNGEQG